MGHSVATLLKHYTASIEHLEDNGPVEGNKLIEEARAKVAQEHAEALAAAGDIEGETRLPQRRPLRSARVQSVPVSIVSG